MRSCVSCQAPLSERAKKYCPDCRYEQLNCAHCGTTFIRDNGTKPDKIYCQRSCYLEKLAEYNRLNKDGHANRGSAVANASAAERGLARRTTDWYLKRDGEHEHRVVAAAVLGRPLQDGEVVHHEDLNKLNNHPHNLIVFESQSQHARHHGRKHLGQDSCDCKGIRLKEVMPR